MNLTLRKINRKDLRLFLKWWKNEDLIKLTSGIKEKSNEILKKYFNTLLMSKKDKHFLILLDNKAIGHVSLSHRKEGVFEIHIIIGEKKHWGKGYGTIAIMKAVDYAFNKLNYKSIYLEVRPDNKRAIAAYKKCGFIEAGYKKYLNNKRQPPVIKMTLKKNDLKTLTSKF